MPASGGPVSVMGARLLNASPFGMMIESLVPLEKDAVLALRLTIGGQKFDIETRVAACTPIVGGARRGFGIGLEFAHLPEDVRERLKQVLADASEPVKAG
jgi:Tfp pilus assembly protein PilZ